MRTALKLFYLLAITTLVSGCEKSSDPASTPSTASSRTKAKVTGIKREARTASGNAAARAGAPTRPGSSSNKKTSPADEADLQGPGPHVVVTGRVTLADGSPASSATLRLSGYDITDEGWTQADAGETTAGIDGTYRLVGRGLRQQMLRAELEGNAAVVVAVRDKNEQFSMDTPMPRVRRYTRDITLGVAAEIHGRVVDESEQPISGASISFVGDTVQEEQNTRSADGIATSTATGEFTLKDVAPGSRTLMVTSPSHVPVTQLATAPTTEGLTIRMASAGATVRGYVLLKNSSTPVSSTTVHLMFMNMGQKAGAGFKPFKGTSDSFGAYEIPLLPKGKFRLSANAVGQNLGLVPSDHPNGMNLELADRETTEVNLFMYGGITVMGIVFDKETSTPIADANISATNFNMARRENTTTSTADGTFQLSGVFPYSSGQAQFTVKRAGYSLATDRSNRGSVSVTTDPEEDVAYKEVPMLKTVTVSGTVRTKDGVPIPTAKVKPWDRQNGSGNDREPGLPVRPDGTYEVEASRFDTVRIMAEAPSFASDFSEPVQVAGESVKDVDIVLEPGAVLSGIVVGPDEQPVAGADVSMARSVQIASYGHSQTLGSSTTGPDGKFSFANLPKSVKATAKKKGFAPSKQADIALEPGGARSDTVLHLRPAQFIAGRVLDASGEAVAEVSVSGYSSEPGESSSGQATSDKQGNYRLEDLAESTYRIHAWGRNGGRTKQLEGIRTGRTDVDIIFDGDMESNSLMGRVVDDKSGEPLKAFNVMGLGTVKKDRAPGRFIATGLQSANYSFQIEAAGYPTGQFTAEIPKEKVPLHKEFRMGHGGTITGRAVRKGTGEPLANVQVMAYAGSNHYMDRGVPAATAKTGEDGKFTLSPIAAGEAQVTAKPAPPLAPTTRKATVKNGETTELGDVELAGGGTIKGKLARGDKGVPDSRISVSNYQAQVNKEAVTDANGAFTVSDLPAGDYSVSAATYNVQKSVAVKEEETHEVLLRLGSSKLSGRVTRGGKPVAAQISLSYQEGSNEHRSTRSDAEGNYSLQDLPGGKVQVNAYQQSDYQTRKTADLNLPEDGELTQNFDLPDARLTGVVLDSAGAPVPVANVTLSGVRTGGATDLFATGSGKSTKTDSRGAFAFEGLESGSYSVTAAKDGAGLATRGNIAVSERAPAHVELRLSGEGGTLESVALDIADGKPIQRAWCYLNGPEGPLNHGKTRGTDGLVKIENIPAGTYQVQVSAWSYSVSEKTVEIRKGETTRIEDVLYGAGSLQWTIQDRAGKPIAGAKVSIVPMDTASIEQPRMGQTDAKGTFTARGLAPGTYSGLAEIQGRGAATEQFNIKAASHDPKVTTVD